MRKKNTFQKRPVNKEQGIAIIAILLIVATVAALATQMHWQHRISVKRISNLLNLQQAKQYLTGGENWAREILVEDLRDNTTDHLGEVWASSLPSLPIDGGAIQGRLIDLQARFNLNSIIDSKGNIKPESLKQFERLLQILEIDPNIASAVGDWLDTNNYPEFPGGAEDETYTSLERPYKTANHFITDISELMSVKGINKAIYAKLKEHVSALPLDVSLNVNTANSEVLQSLSSRLTPKDVSELLDQRSLGAFENINEFYNLSNIQVNEVKASLETQTEYFLVEIEVSLQERIHRRHTYLYRDLQSGNVTAYQRIDSPTPLLTVELDQLDKTEN